MLTRDYNETRFVPILESDVVGYLYYLWISQGGLPDKIHLETRVCASPNQKFDFVVGIINDNEEKPCIKEPELVIEVKAFPIGMRGPQHRVHWKHVVEDDIPKLASLRRPVKDRYLLLFDEANYLKGLYRARNMSKMNYIKKVRDEEDENILILNVRKTESLLWEFL